MRQRGALLIALALGSASTSSARAQESSQQAAQRAFDEGMALMGEGKIEQACAKLEESQRIEAGMGTQFRLAECYEKAGKTASAWRSYLAVATAARAAHQADREKFALTRADALVPRLSKITIQVPPEVAALSNLALSHNDQVVPAAEWGGLVVDKGTHRLLARATGKAPWSVELEIGEGQTLVVKVPPLADEAAAAPPVAPVVAPVAPITSATAAPVAPAPSAPSARPPDRSAALAGSSSPDESASDGSAQTIAGLVIAGTGVAAIGASVGIGFAAKSRHEESAEFCDGDDCTQDGIDIRDDARGLATVGTAMFIAGAAAAAGGTVLWLLAPSDEDVALGVRPGGIAVRGAW